MIGNPAPATQQHVTSPRMQFLSDALTGLRRNPKCLPCKYFYDEVGSRLFDEICQTRDYYVTRCETEIMRRYCKEMGECLGTGVMLVEFGSGSSIKSRYLLEHLIEPAAYVPVDISREHLGKSADEIAQRYPDIEVLPVCADFTKPFDLPRSRTPASHNAVYFPGSTIGNFKPEAARELLRTIAQMCGHDGGLLIGIDLQKRRQVLERAYNDDQGVTAQFNLNLLHRMNRELGADFDVDAFEHVAYYNEEMGRIEIYLRSRSEQTVTIQGQEVSFESSELIHTEYSHKYTTEGFASLAADVGWKLRRVWNDDQGYFAVLHLIVR